VPQLIDPAEADQRSAAEIASIALLPGEWVCARAPHVLSTVLGSCVAVCLWDPLQRVGGMNHYVLAHAPADQPSPRYGDIAMEVLAAGMQRLGCRLTDLRAKIFGGAAVLNDPDSQIGVRNVALALERLEAWRIPVIAQRTGGENGHYVRFNTDTGEAMYRGLA
jgi:chemotaxis protein CheD